MKVSLLIIFLLFSTATFAQHQVSITIDDVPNAGLYQQDGFRSKLLETIDALSLPVAIFSNEANLYRTPHAAENFKGLEKWITNKNIIAGNHTFNHIGYTASGAAAFEEAVLKGEVITAGLLKQQGKALKYFRFPFNDMGPDSAAQRHMQTFLENKGYILTPFTIENSDWAYSALYEDALQRNDKAKARAIGTTYVNTTLQLFDYFADLCQQRFGRSIKHIYLCHDNPLNRDYLQTLIDGLRKRGYTFITLDKALEDEVYKQPIHYFGNAGFSWIYRWEPDANKRKALLRAEPENGEMVKEYEELQKKK